MRPVKLLLLFIIFAIIGCSGTAVQLSTPNTSDMKREVGNSTLREKIANIGSVRFLYASHPVEYINLSTTKTAILTDEYWFMDVNNKLREICDNVGGEKTATQLVTDSFTGAESYKTAKAYGNSKIWQCKGGTLEFSINSVKTNSYSRASLGGPASAKLMMLVESSYSGKPILSKNQAKLMTKYSKGTSLKDFLESKFKLFGGKALTHARVQPDGALRQEYSKGSASATDIDKDLGVLYDLNAYCTYHGGYMEPLKGYGSADIAFSLIPTDATFQCSSDTKPFYVRFAHGNSKYRYEIFAKEGRLGAKPEQISQAPAVKPSSIGGTLKEILQQKLQGQIEAAGLGKDQFVAVVSASKPVMTVTDVNSVIDVHYVMKNGACDQVAAVTTNTMTHSIDRIENYFRCGTAVKKLQDSPLPSVLPGALSNRVQGFIKTVESTGSVFVHDVYSGVTIVGRKIENTNTKYLYFMKNNQLIYLMQ